MGHGRGIDEYYEAELVRELSQRASDRSEGLCDYCRRPLGADPPCRFPERHRGVVDGAEG